MKRATLLLVSCLLLACSHGRVTTVPVSVDTTITATIDLTQSGTFPEIPDSTKGANGELLAATNAPRCTLIILPDTSTWSRATTVFASRYLQAVSLWLPPEFTPYQFQDTYAAPEDTTTTYWQHILGSWYGTFQSRTSPESFAIWIGPRQGYPESGIWGDSVEQVAFSECRLSTSIGMIPIALFQVQSPTPELSGYHVATYWQIKPGVFIQAAGSGPDSSSQARLLAALGTVRVIQ